MGSNYGSFSQSSNYGASDDTGEAGSSGIVGFTSWDAAQLESISEGADSVSGEFPEQQQEDFSIS